jgi:hypothetical protein
MQEYLTALDLIECSNQPMLTKNLYIISILLLTALVCQGQLPTSNIYLMTMTKGGGKISIKDPVFLTNFNSRGYNNQPSFLDDDVVLFTTNYYSTEQTEIAQMDLFDETLTRITYTKESEYSPQRMADKDVFSCVRVETDNVTQSLSVYPKDGIGYAKRLLHNTNSVGYYTWINKERVAMFLVDEPNHNLAIADIDSEKRKIIIDKIGRTLKMTKTGALLFVHKIAPDEWYIKSYNFLSNQSKTITKTLPGVEDFELLNDGSMLMGKESTLYQYNPKSNNSEWTPVIDLSEYNIDSISRVVSYKNRLLIVDQKS